MLHLPEMTGDGFVGEEVSANKVDFKPGVKKTMGPLMENAFTGSKILTGPKAGLSLTLP